MPQHLPILWSNFKRFVHLNLVMMRTAVFEASDMDSVLVPAFVFYKILSFSLIKKK